MMCDVCGNLIVNSNLTTSRYFTEKYQFNCNGCDDIFDICGVFFSKNYTSTVRYVVGIGK